jgi:uncharacterized membrane protein (UPF0127 family)
MKKFILGLLIIFGIFLLIFFIGLYKLNKLKPSSTFYTQIIDGKIYHLLQARTPSEWAKGLMYYKDKDELKGADGMIFIFPVKTAQMFWNKNTYLDLDLYWLDGEMVVGKSYLPSILRTKQPYIVKSPSEVDRVVELIK